MITSSWHLMHAQWKALWELLPPDAHHGCFLIVQKVDFAKMSACFVDW